ncbi:MAG: hypothetical protein K2Y37_03335 [Pirellulales bacterium]|nr:hypothetical protein [Pirellulales bacterium]
MTSDVSFDEQRKPAPRRWLRFGLRTLLVLVTGCAALFAFWSSESRRYAREQAAAAEIADEGVAVQWRDDTPAWLRRVVGQDGLWLFKSVARVSFPPDGAHIHFPGGGSAFLVGLDDAGLAKKRSPLEHLSNLAELNLSDNKLTDAGMVHLSGLARLEVLDLSYNDVTDKGLAALVSLPSLQRINLRGTRVTDNGISELRRHRPTLAVDR